jgi:acyl-homoserine lactone acylase PvdQ
MPDPGSVSFPSDGPPLASSSSPAAATDTPMQQAIPNDGSIGSQLLHQLLAGPPLASNWELVSARHSATGHAIAVMGPQVGYYVPEILMEEDLHGPGFDARGAAFPGVNLYVELGHGRDYAWSATTATSDNVDTFAEVLCQDDIHYLYKGQCLPMERLDRQNSWTPSVSSQTPPGSETLTIYRTVHGLVYARGTVGGQKVAFASARTTYFHEADSALGFSELNDPGFTTGPRQFQQAASQINFGFNWSYADANHIAYFESGWYPERAAGTSPDFPIFGTGQFDWQGYDPALHTLSTLPFQAHPNAIDPDWLVSWNNKQAPQWSAADDNYYYGSVFRSQLIANFIQRALANGGKMTTEQLVSAMDEAATQDIRSVQLWPVLKQVLGTPSDPRLASAIATLDSWYTDGGHRRDLTNRDITKPGTYQHNDAITIMDAWWPKLLDAEFHPALGDGPFNAVQTLLPFGLPDPGGQPTPPDFAVGWYGQVSKDLRGLLAATGQGPTPADPNSRVYCGNGSFAACQGALQNSLLAALAQTPQQIYGQGACAKDPQASCFDLNTWVVAGGISIPPFPFQNRPTFQQVIEPTRTLPR